MISRAINFHEVAGFALSQSNSLVKRWLPNGKIIGHEYVALNPKRHDKNLGSFRINLRTGKWADFATGDKGGDLISLYAYLFSCTQLNAAKRISTNIKGLYDG